MRADLPPSGKDEKGADVLSERMSEAKGICEEVKAFYRERAAAEEEYAKKLLKISKMSLGPKEYGTLKASFQAVKGELEAMGAAHAEVAVGMRRELEESVASFASTWKDKRKTLQTSLEKLRRTKQAQEQQVQKLKEKYDADCIKINGYIAQQNMLMGKELDKNNVKLEKAQMSVQTSTKDYKAAVKVLQETTHRWNIEWKAACDKYQDLEEERIDFLKGNLWSFANIMSTVCVSDDEACEKIRVSLEKCEVDEVIQAFVQARATGQEIPDPPRYRNFYRKEDHEDETPYKVAQFTRDNNPQYRSTPSEHPVPSDDEMTMRPMTGMSRAPDPVRPMTGMAQHPSHDGRPMTGMAQHHQETTRPMTGMAQHQEMTRPMTGMSQHHSQESIRPMTGMARNETPRAHERSQSRGRPMTSASTMDDSPPASHRSRSRGASQSPLKGVINEYPPEGITQFCRQDSGSLRHGQLSRHSSASSGYSASEAPTQSTSDSSTFALHTPVRSVVQPTTPKVLQRHQRSDTNGSQASPALSPKKSHSFWNFGSKSPKQTTPKVTPSPSPIKNSKSMPTGMAMTVPSLEPLRTSNGYSRRPVDEDPIAPGASVMLNIGNNVLEVNNPDVKKAKREEPVDTTDPLVAALEDLKMASKTPKIGSPGKRSPVEQSYQPSFRPKSRDVPSPPMYDNRPIPRQDTSMNKRPSSSQSNLAAQIPPSRGNTVENPVYDTRRNTLGAPPPAHSAAEMERTRRQYAGQVQQVLTGTGRPLTGNAPPRSTSPRPMSRQSQYADDSYRSRPGSSMSMHGQEPPRSRSPAPARHSQDIPLRSRSPAPGRHPQDLPPRSRSPAPGRPVSRQESMDYARPTSRQEYDMRRSVSPAQQRYDEPPRRSPSPQPYPRAASPNPGPRSRRPSASNPFGISIDRFGNVMDATTQGTSPSPQPYPERSSRHQYTYGSHHRHDIDEHVSPPSENRYSISPTVNSPIHTRTRSKSQSDLRTRAKYTEDGRQILFMAKALYDYNAAIPEECNFRKGDVVLVTRTQDDGWWVGEITGSRPTQRGLVPSNFFKTVQS